MIDSGLLLIDKEKGISSYDVIRRLKSLFRRCGENNVKIGHGGTLDPFATGLLIIMLGTATKKFDSLRACEKTYLVKAEFGYKTDTQDGTGKIIKKAKYSFPVSEEKINAAIVDFKGEIEQLPPDYSALKINGKPAYELARNGQKVELKSRKITVHSFELVKLEFPIADFRISCSGGTYVRTLINDLGDKLGCYATAIELRREKIGGMAVENALRSDELAAMETTEELKPYLR